MNEQKVTPLINGSKPDIEAVIEWVRRKGERGDYAKQSSRIRRTALTQLASVLDDDDPRDPAWLLEHLDEVASRWGHLHPEARGATVSDYRSRVKGTLEDYLKWLANPAYQVGTRSRPKATPPKQSKSKSARTGRIASHPETAPRLRSVPLGSGRVFNYEEPKGEFFMRDVRRIMLQLATLTEDFEPDTPFMLPPAD